MRRPKSVERVVREHVTVLESSAMMKKRNILCCMPCVCVRASICTNVGTCCCGTVLGFPSRFLCVFFFNHLHCYFTLYKKLSLLLFYNSIEVHSSTLSTLMVWHDYLLIHAGNVLARPRPCAIDAALDDATECTPRPPSRSPL